MQYSARIAEIKSPTHAHNADDILLHMIRLGRIRLVKFILNRFGIADINLALRMAVRYHRLKIIDYLLTKGADRESALTSSADYGHLNLIRHLHGKGINIQTDNNYPIRVAAQKGYLAVVQYLHQHGANIRVFSDWCISWAAANGHLDIVKYLHMHGADIQNVANGPLMWAVKNRHLEVIRFLHQNGADILAIEDVDIHPRVAEYVHIKKWLYRDVSALKRLAAKLFVQHYDVLPTTDSIPESVMDILSATKI